MMNVLVQKKLNASDFHLTLINTQIKLLLVIYFNRLGKILVSTISQINRYNLKVR